jgi:Glycosyltransferase family 87
MADHLFARVRQVASPAVIMGLMFYLYGLFHKYDWGHPFIKLFCFVIVFSLIVFLRRRSRLRDLPSGLAKLELIAWAVLLLFIVASYGRKYGPGMLSPPRVDIGYTTVNAAFMLVNERRNPYSSHEINRREELAPEYRGFHYGPLMLAGYVTGVFAPAAGYKIASLTYALLSVLFVSLSIDRSKTDPHARLAGLMFALCIFLSAERFWYEMFTQGANDIFPVCLLLASLLAVKRAEYFLSGLFLGLSFSAKFSPAVFLLITFLRKDLRVATLKGFAIGLSPLLAFAAWDPQGLLNNVFWIRFTIPYDSTSLYSQLRPEFHFILPLALFVAVLYSLYRNFNAPVEYENALVSSTVLMIVGEVTFKEMHTNHLIWFYPLFALILTRHRYQLFAA